MAHAQPVFAAVQPNVVDPLDALRAVAAGGLIVSFLGLLLAVGMLALWLVAFIRAIDDGSNVDRTMWVFVVLLGGPIGALVYFIKVKLPERSGPSALPARVATSSRATVAAPTFNTSDMHDERKRAEAINAALKAG